jgi:RNA polymerase sigma-70 factor (ECF subfamily)
MDKFNERTMADLTIRWTKAQPIVSGFISSMVPNFHDAEDILQRVALVLVRKFDQYDRNSPFVGWALGIAKYEILAYKRRKTTDKHLFDHEIITQMAAAYERTESNLPPVRRALVTCLEKFQGRNRRLLEMWYTNQHSAGHIARALRIAKSTVYVILHRTRVALRRCVERQLKPVDY